MEKLTQLYSTTPQELVSEILKGVHAEIKKLKEEYQPKSTNEYLTRDEVSKLLKIDLSTVHNWCKRGKLQPWGIGNRVYFKRTQVEAAIKPLNQ